MLALMVKRKNGTHMIEKYFEKETNLKCWLLHTIFIVVFVSSIYHLLAPGFGETIVPIGGDHAQPSD